MPSRQRASRAPLTRRSTRETRSQSRELGESNTFSVPRNVRPYGSRDASVDDGGDGDGNGDDEGGREDTAAVEDAAKGGAGKFDNIGTSGAVGLPRNIPNSTLFAMAMRKPRSPIFSEYFVKRVCAVPILLFRIGPLQRTCPYVTTLHLI